MEYHDELLRWIEKHEKLSGDYSHLGAMDTEPQFVWQDVLWCATEGRPYPANAETAGEWELYERLPGAGAAAVRLTMVARCAYGCITVARDCAPAKEWRHMREFLHAHCWRANNY